MPLYLFLRAIRTISITVKTQEGLIINEPGLINFDISSFGSHLELSKFCFPSVPFGKMHDHSYNIATLGLISSHFCFLLS